IRMKLLLLIALFACLIHVEGSCNIMNNIVIEIGYPPREMTAEEKAQMVVYGQQWNEWGAQFSRYMTGRDVLPTAPVMPCLCHNCK
ncbi:hypothetical protein PENTCL1PPCAC_16044, partial [Pristionchus entomophagus]